MVEWEAHDGRNWVVTTLMLVVVTTTRKSKVIAVAYAVVLLRVGPRSTRR